jgi:two-component system phosphate regulon sensor histidine kinase PhoR
MKRLWSNSLIFKVFISYLAIVALLFLSFYFYAGALLRDLYVSTLSTRMEREARLIASTLPFSLKGVALDDIVRKMAGQVDARITIVALDGQVLGDSAESSKAMENHANRPEIIEAMDKGDGYSVRYSDTVGLDLLYRAVLYDYGMEKRVVRLAFPLADIEETISRVGNALLLGLLIASVVGLAIAYAFADRLGRRFARLVEFSRRLAAGSFPHNFFSGKGRDEINVLEEHLNEMSGKLRDNMQQIMSEKEKSDSILRCMIEGVLVIDPKGQVVIINDQAKRMFEIPSDRDVRGASVAELSRHPEMLAMMHDSLRLDLSNQGYSREVELDERRWFRINAVPLRDGARQRRGSLLVFHDISVIKRLEMVRSDFVANVSHELRTPLTAIRGYVETLLRNPPRDSAAARHFLGVIERNSDRLSRLTEDLLILSDLESGHLPLALRAVDVAQLAQRVMEVFDERASEKQVELVKEVAPGLPPIAGDFDRLQQLFINLVDNAVKYSPVNGTVTFKATEARSGDSPPMIAISIADTGSGIPEKDIPRLTERFYRVDKARSRELGGTGLGLAIVKHIVQAHQGKLKIESVLQKGTTVHVHLPAVQQKPAFEPPSSL